MFSCGLFKLKTLGNEKFGIFLADIPWSTSNSICLAVSYPKIGNLSASVGKCEGQEAGFAPVVVYDADLRVERMALAIEL